MKTAARPSKSDGARLEYTGVAHNTNWFAGLMEPVITAPSRKKLEEDIVKLKLLEESQ